MTSNEYAKIINDIKEGVDKSVFGPVFQYPDEDDFASKKVNNLAWALITIMLTQVMKNINPYEEDKDCIPK